MSPRSTSRPIAISGRRDAPIRAPGGFRFVKILIVEAVILNLLTLPLRMQLAAHLYRDAAGLLGFHYLVTHGYRANIDFGYPYGLLWPLVQRGWFAIFGATSSSVAVIRLGFEAIAAGTLAKIAINLRVSFSGKLLIAVAMPFVLAPQELVRLETVLLLFGLEQQSRGNYAKALAFATAAAFAKPTMAYFYGAILIAIASWRLYRDAEFNLPSLARLLLPSFCVAVTLFLAIALTFGARSAIATLLPIRGGTAYREMNFGFFTGVGRYFWYFPGVRPGYYFGTVAAFWLAGSVWLLWSGAVALVRLFDGDSSHARAFELVATCAILHVLFVSIFFGSAASWSYYAFILIGGLAATSAYSESRTALSLLTIVAIVGTSGLIRSAWNGWAHTSRGADGLWAPHAERAEWESVQQFVAGHRATMLATFSGAELLTRNLEPPTCLLLIRGSSVPAEVLRKANQIERSELIVVPTAADSSLAQILAWNPPLKPALENLRLVRPGVYFQVYGHPAPLR